MKDYVSLQDLNKLRFNSSPVATAKLQRWCREGVLPARKFGSEWRVDLEEFDKVNQNNLDPLTAKVLSKLT